MSEIYKISNSTKFPVEDNGQKVLISANTLLRNIELILDKATEKDLKENQQTLFTGLDKVQKVLNECMSKMSKALALSESSNNFNNKIWDQVISNSERVNKLEADNKNLQQRLHNIENKLNRFL